jgi:hypothetical protein
MKMTAEERFWSKVDKRGPDDCWEWTGGKLRGYGIFSAAHGHSVRANRFAWETSFGPIPKGKRVCHTCDNPPCCNPAHLFCGTQKDNVDDMFRKGRSRTQLYCKLGKTWLRRVSRKFHWLSPAAVSAIVASYDGKWGREKQLAKQYGVTHSCISRIIRARGLGRTDGFPAALP